MKRILLALMLIASPALAAGPDNENTADPATVEPTYDVLAVYKVKIDYGKPEDAVAELQEILKKHPGNPDVLSILGYGSRKLERWDASRSYYEQALAADPVHRDALEYMAELELQVGDVEAARALMVRLKEACPKGCSELKLLEKAFKKAGVSAEGGES
ncbi:MAG: tetratricopeptide repeat protein [Pseudomonadota bacterium]